MNIEANIHFYVSYRAVMDKQEILMFATLALVQAHEVADLVVDVLVATREVSN